MDEGFDIFVDPPKPPPRSNNGPPQDKNFQWPKGPEEYGLSADAGREPPLDGEQE